MKQFLIIAFLLLCNTVFAQSEFGRDSLEKHTEAILHIEGKEPQRIYISSNIRNPEEFQSKIIFIDADHRDQLVKDDQRVKIRYYDNEKAKNIQKLVLWNGITFVNEKYADLTELGIGSIPKTYLIHQLVDGEISIYKLYKPYSYILTPGSSEEDKAFYMEKMRRFHEENGTLIISKNDDRLKAAQNIKIEDFVSDKPEILEAVKLGIYEGIYEKFNTAIKSSTLNPNNYKVQFIQLARDYNAAE